MKSKVAPQWSASYGFLMTILFGLMVVLYAQARSGGAVPRSSVPSQQRMAPPQVDSENEHTRSVKSEPESASQSSSTLATQKASSKNQRILNISAASQRALDQIAALGALPSRENSVQGNTPAQERVSYEWIGSSSAGAKQIRFHVERDGAPLYAPGAIAMDAELEALVFRIGELLAKTRRELPALSEIRESRDSRIVIQVTGTTRAMAAARAERIAKLWTGSRILTDQELILETSVTEAPELAWVMSLP